MIGYDMTSPETSVGNGVPHKCGNSVFVVEPDSGRQVGTSHAEASRLEPPTKFEARAPFAHRSCSCAFASPPNALLGCLAVGAAFA